MFNSNFPVMLIRIVQLVDFCRRVFGFHGNKEENIKGITFEVYKISRFSCIKIESLLCKPAMSIG